MAQGFQHSRGYQSQEEEEEEEEWLTCFALVLFV
jgi:hypothetical protein